MEKEMKKSLSLLSILMLTQACSMFAPASHVAEKNSGMPDFYVFNDFKKTKGRTIASAEAEKPASTFSNRKIYFLTLLNQYNEFKMISRLESPDIKVCPSFHTEIIDSKKTSKQNINVFVDLAHLKYDFNGLMKKESQLLSLYPEMALPLTADSLHPSVIDVLKDSNQNELPEMMVKAYKIHLGKIYTELQDMCEKGQTDNFFVFENLVTYTKSHQDFKDQATAMKSILKSSVFANMYLLKSFKIKNALERNIASNTENLSSLEEEVIARTDTFWVKNYFDELKTRRVEKNF
jgi:hypothetical protein